MVIKKTKTVKVVSYLRMAKGDLVILNGVFADLKDWYGVILILYSKIKGNNIRQNIWTRKMAKMGVLVKSVLVYVDMFRSV